MRMQSSTVTITLFIGMLLSRSFNKTHAAATSPNPNGPMKYDLQSLINHLTNEDNISDNSRNNNILQRNGTHFSINGVLHMLPETNEKVSTISKTNGNTDYESLLQILASKQLGRLSDTDKGNSQAKPELQSLEQYFQNSGPQRLTPNIATYLQTAQLQPTELSQFLHPANIKPAVQTFNNVGRSQQMILPSRLSQKHYKMPNPQPNNKQNFDKVSQEILARPPPEQLANKSNMNYLLQLLQLSNKPDPNKESWVENAGLTRLSSDKILFPNSKKSQLDYVKVLLRQDAPVREYKNNNPQIVNDLSFLPVNYAKSQPNINSKPTTMSRTANSESNLVPNSLILPNDISESQLAFLRQILSTTSEKRNKEKKFLTVNNTTANLRWDKMENPLRLFEEPAHQSQNQNTRSNLASVLQSGRNSNNLQTEHSPVLYNSLPLTDTNNQFSTNREIINAHFPLYSPQLETVTRSNISDKQSIIDALLRALGKRVPFPSYSQNPISSKNGMFQPGHSEKNTGQKEKLTGDKLNGAKTYRKSSQVIPLLLLPISLSSQPGMKQISTITNIGNEKNDYSVPPLGQHTIEAIYHALQNTDDQTNNPIFHTNQVPTRQNTNRNQFPGDASVHGNIFPSTTANQLPSSTDNLNLDYQQLINMLQSERNSNTKHANQPPKSASYKDLQNIMLSIPRQVSHQVGTRPNGRQFNSNNMPNSALHQLPVIQNIEAANANNGNQPSNGNTEDNNGINTEISGLINKISAIDNLIRESLGQK